MWLKKVVAFSAPVHTRKTASSQTHLYYSYVFRIFVQLLFNIRNFAGLEPKFNADFKYYCDFNKLVFFQSCAAAADTVNTTGFNNTDGPNTTTAGLKENSNSDLWKSWGKWSSCSSSCRSAHQFR